MLYVFEELPTSVRLPVAVTAAVSPFLRPVMFASSFVSGVPSYSFAALPVVIVTGAFLTVSVPGTFSTLVKFAVLSTPFPSLMMYPSFTTFAELPASVRLPADVASTVNPVGRPSHVTPSAFSSAVPSYTFVASAAISFTSLALFVTSSVPRFSVIA